MVSNKVGSEVTTKVGVISAPVFDVNLFAVGTEVRFKLPSCLTHTFKGMVRSVKSDKLVLAVITTGSYETLLSTLICDEIFNDKPAVVNNCQSKDYICGLNVIITIDDYCSEKIEEFKIY